jgi:HEPN/Toprim N-terminal domain 1
MGSRANLRLGNVVFETWKDQVDDSIMVLFSESEKRIQQIAPDPDDEPLDDDDEPSTLLRVEYATNIKVLKKRLDFVGFTLNTCRQMFDIAKTKEIRDRKRWIEDHNANFGDEVKKQLNEYYSRRINLLSQADADTWLLELRRAFLAPPDADPGELSELANSLRPGGLPHFLNPRFPEAYDERFRLRFELEALQTGEAVLDISDLVDAGYCSPSDPLSSWAREWVHTRDREALHLIVLTEGSSDKFVLESALCFLRPELTEYIFFMDFAAFKVEGGASFLANMVRSFAGAGIRDRIVAIFDNDTAGCSAQSMLSKQDLPENIKVMRYPDIVLARNYPTQGPSGDVTMDVNGSAASIELYLGRDVLAEPNGALVPVQWKALDPIMKRYQGEVVGKRGCITRFSEKLLRFERSSETSDLSDWGDLGTIIDAICSAFENTDRELLLDEANWAAS